MRRTRTQSYPEYMMVIASVFVQQYHHSLINTSRENSQIKSRKRTNDSAARVFLFNWFLAATFAKARDPEI